MALAWFTYDTVLPSEDATANLGNPRHRWLTAQGPYIANMAELDIIVSRGGVFDSSQYPVSREMDGTISLKFHDCNSATFSYEIDSLHLTGEIPIQRVAGDNVALCEALE